MKTAIKSKFAVGKIIVSEQNWCQSCKSFVKSKLEQHSHALTLGLAFLQCHLPYFFFSAIFHSQQQINLVTLYCHAIFGGKGVSGEGNLFWKCP